MRNPPKRPLDHVPEAVTYAREMAGITRTLLAQRLGVSPSLVTEIERGTRNATPLMISRLSRVLGCPRPALERSRIAGAAPAAITYARVHARLTVAQLAREVGVTADALEEIERGERDVTPSTLRRIAHVLNCPQGFLESDTSQSGATGHAA